MLRQLRVKNLALVKNTEIEFEGGLNVITGETGAGKSIVMGALSLLLGERADHSLIRAGETACGVEALFDLHEPSEIDEILESQGLEPTDNGQLIIRRIVRASGSNQNLVNDHTVTLQTLKKIGDLLVDMHGPHDHQSLFRQEFQLELLDAYGHLWEKREQYETCYQELVALRQRLEEMEGGPGDVAEQMDLLRYRVQEMEDAQIEVGEEEKLQAEHKVIGHAQRILELGGAASHALLEADESAFDHLAATQRALNELSNLLPEAQAWKEEANSVAIQLQELGSSISSYMENLESDPNRLAWLDERLGVYQQMKRKYAPTAEAILELLAESKERLNDLETRDEQLEKIRQDMERVTEQLMERGRLLSDMRREAATQLGVAVTRQLEALGFEHGSFEVALTDAEPRSTGIDEIEFGFAPNKGEPMKPLRAIASSGEISRVMLATKVVLAGHDRIPLLVFDEIDANVGGEMGNAIGEKLADVSTNHQVICITHLPQVAVHGSTHFAVSKYVEEDRTFTTVQRLDQDQRVDEVARMLGGRSLTGVIVDHARQMLEKKAIPAPSA